MPSFTFFRNKFFTSAVCIVVAVQMFNLSIDPADTGYGNEDLSVNEIESCVELILEIILEREGAVQESEESDESRDRPGPKLTVFTVSNVTTIERKPASPIRHRNYRHTAAHPESLNMAIIPPPPRA